MRQSPPLWDSESAIEGLMQSHFQNGITWNDHHIYIVYADVYIYSIYICIYRVYCVVIGMYDVLSDYIIYK